VIGSRAQTASRGGTCANFSRGSRFPGFWRSVRPRPASRGAFRSPGDRFAPRSSANPSSARTRRPAPPSRRPATLADDSAREVGSALVARPAPSATRGRGVFRSLGDRFAPRSSPKPIQCPHQAPRATVPAPRNARGRLGEGKRDERRWPAPAPSATPGGAHFGRPATASRPTARRRSSRDEKPSICGDYSSRDRRRAPASGASHADPVPLRRSRSPAPRRPQATAHGATADARRAPTPSTATRRTRPPPRTARRPAGPAPRRGRRTGGRCPSCPRPA
jgi:hypothetical protein